MRLTQKNGSTLATRQQDSPEGDTKRRVLNSSFVEFDIIWRGFRSRLPTNLGKMFFFSLIFFAALPDFSNGGSTRQSHLPTRRKKFSGERYVLFFFLLNFQNTSDSHSRSFFYSTGGRREGKKKKRKLVRKDGIVKELSQFTDRFTFQQNSHVPKMYFISSCYALEH